MKASLCAAICLAAFPLHARADLVVVQTVEIAGKGMILKTTTEAKGNTSRTDMATPEGVLSGKSTLTDLATGDSIKLDLRLKQYTKRTVAQIMNGSQGALLAKLTPIELKDTGRREKAAGYDSEVYTAESSYASFTYWMTKDYPDGAALAAEMKKLHASQTAFYHTPDLAKLEGVLVKSEITVKAGVEAPDAQTMDVTLVSAKIMPLADSEFQVPADFTEVAALATPTPAPAPGPPLPTAIPDDVIPQEKYEALDGKFSITFTGPGTVLYEYSGGKITGTFLPPKAHGDQIIMIGLDEAVPPKNTRGVFMFKIIGKGMLYAGYQHMLAVASMMEKAKAVMPDYDHLDQADVVGGSCRMYAMMKNGKYPRQLADVIQEHLLGDEAALGTIPPEKIIAEYDYLGAGATDKDNLGKIILRSKYTTSDGRHIIVPLNGTAKFEDVK